MKKGILVGILVVIIALIVLTPFAVGRSFERQYSDLISQLNRVNQTAVLSIESYQRGWFCSTATLKVTERVQAPTTNESGFVLPESLILQQDISHGPLVRNQLTGSFTFAMAGIRTNIHLPDTIETMLLGNKKKEGLVSIYTIAHFNDSYQNQVKAPALSVKMPPFGELSWQGMNGESSFAIEDDKFSQFQSQVEIGALTVTSDVSNASLPPKMLYLQPIKISNTASRHASGLWVGRSEITLTGLTAKQNNAVQLAFDNFQMTSIGNVNANQLYDVSEKITLHKLQIPQTSIAEISPLNLTFSIENLNGKAFVETMNRVDAMPVGGWQASPALQQQYLALLSQLIVPATVANTDVFINTGLGAFQLKGKLYWMADKPLATPVDSLNNAQYTLDIKIAAPLADHLFLLYAKAMERQAIEASAKANHADGQGSDKEKFNIKVATLLQQGQVSLPATIEVMNLYDQKLLPADFTQQLAGLGLLPQASTELVQLYTHLYNQKAATQPASPVMPAAANPQNVANAMRDQWLSQGYLVKEGNDYTFSMRRENGITRMNGAAAAAQPVPAQLP